MHQNFIYIPSSSSIPYSTISSKSQFFQSFCARVADSPDSSCEPTHIIQPQPTHIRAPRSQYNVRPLPQKSS